MVFSILIKDLKDLEDSGMVLRDGKVIRCSVCSTAGDNLVSHSISGFVENFNKSSYFCRFCDIDRQTFQLSPWSVGSKRTKQSYQQHVKELGTRHTDSVCGIKFDSIFNQLHYFHVCQLGLPPCL